MAFPDRPLTVAEARDQIVREMTEKTLQAFTLQAARGAGFVAYHTWNSQKSAPGFPDLVMAKPGRLLFVELKRHGKHPTEAQQAWLDTLAQVAGDVEVYVWTPESWVDGTIIRILTGDTNGQREQGISQVTRR